MTNRAERCLSFFVRDKARLGRCVGWYIHHRNLYLKGKGEVGFVLGLVNGQSLMIGWLFFRDLFPWMKVWMFVPVVVLLSVLKIVSYWVMGWWWDVYNYYDRESDWANRRNPISKAVSETLLNGRGIE